jgi:hypothetical protein
MSTTAQGFSKDLAQPDKSTDAVDTDERLDREEAPNPLKANSVRPPALRA